MIAQHLRIAFDSIKATKLRSLITALIISIGIMALVGILTAIDSIKASLTENFSVLGSNSFNIRPVGRGMRFGNGGVRGKTGPVITLIQANKFSAAYAFPGAHVSRSCNAHFTAVVRSNGVKSNPNISVIGADENYLQVAGYTLAKGRNFNDADIAQTFYGALIGKDVATTLFGKSDPLGQAILVSNERFIVVGVLGEKGSAMGFGGDRVVMIPFTTAIQAFAMARGNVQIGVCVDRVEAMDQAIGEAEAVFRNIRGMRSTEPSDFEFTRSDGLANMLISSLSQVTGAAILIAIITLLGAAVGLMNIMLVSVTERTREIGTRKALGARSSDIRNQFLVEALVIGQMGGLGGIALGIIIGNLIGNLVGATFIIPWAWMFLGVFVCLIVGTVSGYYPARKASKLPPIEALRYE